MKDIVAGFTQSAEFANRLAQAKKPDGFSIGRALLSGGVYGSDELTRQMYISFLGRNAEPGAYPGWRPVINQNFGTENFVAIIFASQEYFERNSGTNRGFVTSLYRNLLNREPDPGGLDGWSAAVPAIGRDAVVRGFLNSGEFRAQLIRYLYAAALLRSAPPSPGEVEAWVGYWNGGVQIPAIVAGFIGSAEFRDARARGI
jgi:hypothetical protein